MSSANVSLKTKNYVLVTIDLKGLVRNYAICMRIDRAQSDFIFVYISNF